MSTEWESFDWRSTVVPRQPLSDSDRERLGVPLTLRPIEDARALQAPVFDPALKHHQHGYRATDPRFEEPGLTATWQAARRRAMDLVLCAIADSGWVDHLVLRGSVLLRAWFGEAAREPGDLDFVLVPEDWEVDEERTEGMLRGIAAAVERTATLSAGPVRFEAAAAVDEEIWTYDRVPGRRLVLPWTAGELPGGAIQLDFVFNESLPVPSAPIAIPSSTGAPAAVLHAATPELSLAWKLMWLATDTYPQGKDLYDAVLLAEHTLLRYQVLRDAFVGGDPEFALTPVTTATVDRIAAEVEWDHFQGEYPQITGTDAEYTERLAAALAPVFSSGPATLEGRSLKQWWLAGWTARYREVFAEEGMSATQAAMAREGLPIAAAMVVTGELLGLEQPSPDEIMPMLLGHRAWKHWGASWEEDRDYFLDVVLRALDD
ncbi:nucleotidyl transferase AbiEii/AbiGii toxin family protein [Kitasatospora sp. NPDC006697]|uniref:nucleotidyl transferase AbiEii/AbiGii toxin family protein n=1 Tax=Kitasatospora sp. NPDC006697 TaxID=3364020 RepID=UPI0036890726